jgi:methionine synthase II (cobalamin-independent)
MDLQPGIPTTMIGSLPCATAAAARDMLNVHPLSVPAWSQLPKRSFREGMIAQYSEGFPGIVIDDTAQSIRVERDAALLDQMAAFYEDVVAGKTDRFAISRRNAAGLHSLLELLGRQNAKPPLVKGQVTGPFTFGLSLVDSQRQNVWFDEQYRDVVVRGLAGKALWQARQLRNFAERAIIFFDEPIFSALGTPAYLGIQDEDVVRYLNEVIAPVRAAGVRTGVHCCGNMDWGLLTRTAADIISFDAYAFADKLALYADAVHAFLERGGTLAWGLVPTGDARQLAAATADGLRQKLAGQVAAFVGKGVREELLWRQMMLTPSCGMGTLTETEAGKVLQLLEEVGKMAAGE